MACKSQVRCKMFATPSQIHGFCTDFLLVIIGQLVQQPFRVLLVIAERLLQGLWYTHSRRKLFRWRYSPKHYRSKTNAKAYHLILLDLGGHFLVTFITPGCRRKVHRKSLVHSTLLRSCSVTQMTNCTPSSLLCIVTWYPHPPRFN
jgi:hypothetical protein